jgi:hypothetical protein
MRLLKFLLLILACLLSLFALAYYVSFDGGQALGSSAE